MNSFEKISHSEKIRNDFFESASKKTQISLTKNPEWQEKIKTREREDSIKIQEIRNKLGIGHLKNIYSPDPEKQARAEANLLNIQSGTQDYEKSVVQKKQQEKEEKENYFKNYDPAKSHKELFDHMENLRDPDGSIRKREQEQKEYWDNYHNTTMGMNEYIGYKPISESNYKSALEKETRQKGASDEEIEKEWREVRRNPHASWMT